MNAITATAHTAPNTLTNAPGVDVWAAFLAEQDTAPATRATYERALRRYRAWLDENELEPFEATRQTVISYRDEVAQGHKAATVNAYLTAVRSFYGWAEARRIYPNIAQGIKGPRMNARSAKESLTKAQAERLLERPTAPLTEAQARDYALVNLMARRGLRTCEVARADVGDVRQVNGQAVLYVQGKGYSSKGDFVVLGEECLDPILAYLAQRGNVDDSAPLFAAVGNRNHGGRMTTRSISRIAKKLMGEAGIDSPRITAHSLRHTAVTFALLGGASVQDVQQMARHADISTTMIYAHNLDRMSAKAERAADAYLAC